MENAGEEDNTTENTEGIIELTITNTFEVPSETTNIEVTKIWNDNHNRAGKRAESVTLVLTGNSKSYEVTLTKENEVEGQENIWKGTIENLPKYDENADIINYELSEENLNNIFYTEENMSIDQQTKTVTNKFEVPDDKIEIEVNKKWEDNHNELGRRPEEVTLYLTGNNQEHEITLNESNKTAEDESIWRGTIGNLPKYDVNGNEIAYILDERPIASEFYTKTGIDQGSRTVTNKFGIPTENIQVPVTKIWEDNNNAKGYRPENIVLQIKEKGTGEVVSEQLVQGNKTTNEGWSYIFEVPKYNEEGQEVEYEIGDRELNNKFYPSTSTKIDQDQKTITNVFTVPDEKIEITVNKIWVDNETQEKRRPESVIIRVIGDNGEEQTKEISAENNQVENDKDSWRVTFTGLSKYNAEGDEVKYTVEEQEKNPGDLHFYTTQIGEVIESGENSKAVTIANIFKTPEDTTQILVNKIWKDNETQSSRRPESIILVVKNGEQEVKTQEITKEDMLEGTTNQWSTTIDGLQKYDENGEEIQYTVEEREKTEGDLKFYEAEEANVPVEDGQATIRNNFKTPEDTISVTVNKVWNDSNDANGKRPESINLQVRNGKGVAEEEIVNVGNANNGNTNKWTYTFTNLPKYDENGEEIVYTVSEEEVNTDDLKFYTSDIGEVTNVENEEDKKEATITNTFTVPEEKIELTVNKVWEDNNTQELRRPESIIINVKAENGDNNNPEEVIQTYELNTKTETSHTFTDLPKYNGQGQDIQYTVEEQEKNPGDLHFYTNVVGEITNVDEDSKEVTITNTFTKPDDKTEVTVTKVWNDNQNEAEKRPESIKLQLKNGNDVVKEQEVNESNAINENTWQYTFTDVEKYNDNGEEIAYTADETEVNSNDLQFYDKVVRGLTVTNTFTQNTDTVDIPVTKIWEDNETQAQRRPESVVIVLKANGEEKQRYELSAGTAETANDNTWTYTFKDMQKYDEYNNIINYTVEEEEKNPGDLKFYTNKVEGTTITNTFTKPTDTISIQVNKEWVDQENIYEKRPVSIRLEVKHGETIVTSEVVTKDDNWSETFIDLAKYDDNGEEIVYTVDEEEVSQNDLFNYEKEIGEVTNKEGATDEKEATITNTMIKIPGTVVVRYVDKNTGEDISERRIKEGIIGDPFDVTEDKKDITGYTLVEEPVEKTGEYTEETQEKIYYYAKNTSVVVKYLEKDETPEDIADNRVLAEEKTIQGYEGESYITEKEEVTGYTCVETTNNTSGTMQREQIEVIYYYAPNTTITVKYLERDNTPNDNSDNKVLAPEVIINGYVGKEYTTTEETVPNYTLVETTNNTEGTMTKDPIEVIYYYAPNTNVIVKYLEKDDTPNNNADNKVLAAEETINGYVGKEYKTEQKKISNYTFVESTNNTEGIMTKDVIEVIYYYAQNTKATVQLEKY